MERKQKLLDDYTRQQQLPSRKALMLIITKNIEHAEEVQQILKDCHFPPENTLRVDSSSINEAMAQQLQNIDDPANSIRIIVAVGMLKEGWDVKGVYIIVPLRAFASEILTEQVIGRGLRLPFGQYTPVNFLNQLEIITHDKFQDLLNNRGALAKNFFGEQASENKPPFDNSLPNDRKTGENFPSSGYPIPDLPVSDFQERQQASQEQLPESFSNFPKDENFTITILTQKPKSTKFSLEFIFRNNKQRLFTELGERFSTREKARSYLERHEIKSDIDTKQIKINKITEELTKASQPELSSQQIEELRTELILSVMGNCVIHDNEEVKLAKELINDYFLPKILNWSIIMDCRGIITTLLKREVEETAHQYNLQENKDDLIYQVVDFTFKEHSRKEIVASDYQDSSLQKSYQFNNSLYHYDNFDSLLEKDFAVLLDNSLGIKWWIRLQKEKDFFIYYWNGKKYYPDFLVVENGDYWLIEVKNDNNTEEKVKAKKEMAQKWVNKLNRELIKQKNSKKWHFLYITPKDIKKSHDNWGQLKLLEERN
ncbi:hypothetical protein [endosymbiont GvMRE of Glomus versiforme]|uniref:hypothetical protein n=1 Tax=endosymbiont GvMRE of Glomus versiforme TaxID=2039283 RepID=UPI0011C46A78|nr:hypothetical protein [endosymbiont GvMRE of Glomus versiforme]